MRAHRVICIYLGILWTILLWLTGCQTQPSNSSIYLSALKPLPDRTQDALIPLRVSVAAVISPQGTAESYQLLLNYLSAKLDRPVELVQRRTYAETNDLVESRYVDLAFVCTSAYIAGHDKFNMSLLVAPQVDGQAVYYSYLIVPQNSQALSIKDLEGTTFAFTDPMSNTGRAYPLHLIQQLGTTPKRLFARTFYTYSHDDAIRAVADGLADGAAVDSLVYEFALERDPSLAQRIKVIHRSPPFGIPPVVVSPEIRPQLRARLQEILLGMGTDPKGQIALETLGIDGFVIIDDGAYQSARELIRKLEADSP